MNNKPNTTQNTKTNSTNIKKIMQLGKNEVKTFNENLEHSKQELESIAKKIKEQSKKFTDANKVEETAPAMPVADIPVIAETQPKVEPTPVKQEVVAEQPKQQMSADQFVQIRQTNDNRSANSTQSQQPQNQGGYQNNRPQGQGGYQGSRPQGQGEYQNNRPQGQGGYQGSRPQGQGEYQNNRPQGQGGYQGTRPQGQGGYQGTRPQGSGGYQGTRPQGQGGYQGTRPQGQGGYQGTRPQGQGGYQGTRPQGQGGYQGTRPQGPGGYQGTRPQGPGGYQGNRPQGPGGYQGNRPQGPGGYKPTEGFTSTVAPKVNLKTTTKKKDPIKKVDEKKTLTKKALLQKGYIQTDDYDENRLGSKFKSKKAKKAEPIEFVKIEKAVVANKVFTIKHLSEKIGVTAAEIVKKLFKEGVVRTVNESIDYDTAALICADLNIELELKEAETAEEVLVKFQTDDDDNNLVKRPPIITVMGHVDHGKTSLLDSIRNADVASGEAGGITQHIGAYSVTLRGESITFIDTPGHEAFTAMRSRGSQITDIAILVVAGDDGVMPQTIESINHAKVAKVPVIVAINKMDKPNTNIDRIKQQLAEHGLLDEAWGGDTIMVPVSAKTGMGIEQLLDTVLLVAEVQELKANPDASAKGVVVEARLDKGKGPIATILVNNGTLNIGDVVVSGTVSGKVRAMLNDKGQNVKKAGPSTAVSILGFSDVPHAGDSVDVVADEKMAKTLISERDLKIREKSESSSSKMSLDDVFTKISEGQMKNLNLIIKADVQGSVEALRSSLNKLGNEEVKINIIHSGVGAVSETDVMLASTSNAIIVCFNVRPDNNANTVAEREGIDVRRYSIIYDVINDIESALTGMLAPKFRENIIGQVEVRSIFRASGIGTIAGCYVTSGKAQRSAKIRLLRDNIVIHDGEISSLKRFKDDAKEVATGYECGITLANYNDIKEGDVFEIYVLEQY